MTLARPGALPKPEISDVLAERVDRAVAQLRHSANQRDADLRYAALAACYLADHTDARGAEGLRVSRVTFANARRAAESWVEGALYSDIDAVL